MNISEKEPGREPEIATGTLAEIYAQQGLYDRALEIYRRIERRRPDDPRIASRIAALEKARDDPEAEEEAAVVSAERAGETATTHESRVPPESPVEDESAPEPEDSEGPSLDEAFREWLETR